MHLGDINCFRSAYKLKHLMRMMEIKWKKNKHILDMILLYFFVLIWSKIIFYRQIVYLDWWIFSNKLNIDCILQLCSLYNILTYLMVSVYLSVNITMILGGNDFWVIKGLYEDCSDFFSNDVAFCLVTIIRLRLFP